MNPPARIAAIVGRPNVGKSALFNRLVGRRVSIVHEESGVTRDRLICEVTWNDQRFELMDTGGIGLIDNASPGDDIARGIQTQAEVAIQDAAVLILVVDISAGVVPLDLEVARLLRRSGRPVLVAANKADHERRDAHADEFSALGYPVFPISALHGRGLAALIEALLIRLPPADPRPREPALKVAVVGRPNVGKSSFINRLLRSDRVIVSDVPGTTRDSIEIPFVVGGGAQARHYLLIDTAGIRKRGRRDGAVEQFSLMRTEKSIEHADVVVLMLDAAEGPTAGEKKIAGLVQQYRRGCVLLVNKWDLAGAVTQREYLKGLRRALPFLHFVPIVFCSARSGFNVRGCVDAMDLVGAQIRSELSTGVLNRVLHEALHRVDPPMIRGKRMKLFYATQTGTHPVRVGLFVNEPARLTEAYRAYLVQQLRRTFGLEGAPVVLDFRRRSRKPFVQGSTHRPAGRGAHRTHRTGP